MLSRWLVAAGGLAGGAVVLAGSAEEGRSAQSQEQDERIFNFALGLEYLQAAFYAHALERGQLRGELREFARVVGGQERAHVRFIRDQLGNAAREEPEFDFGDLAADEERFSQAALALEESGVGGYIGQGANLTVEGVAAAAPIVSVEARHAAWIRDLVGENPAPAAADPAKTAAQVRSELERAGFQLPA